MWAGLNLALSAANLADVSGDTLRKDAVAEVYVLAAVTIRFYFPSQLHFFAVSTHLLLIPIPHNALYKVRLTINNRKKTENKKNTQG